MRRKLLQEGISNNMIFALRTIMKRTQKVVFLLLITFMLVGSVLPNNPNKVYAYDTPSETTEEVVAEDEKVKYKTTTDDDFDISSIAIESEDTSKRTADSKTFRRADGTYVLAMYDSVIHYKENGVWKDIDNTLVSDNETNSYENTANAFSIKLPKQIEDNKKFKLSMDDYQIDWTIDSISKTDITYFNDNVKSNSLKELDSINQTVTYYNVQNDVDLEYVLNGNQIKENIILNSYIEDYSMTFNYSVKNLSLVQNEFGKYQFINDLGEIIFSLDTLYMYDANGEVSYDIDFKVTEEKMGEYTIQIIPNNNFLSTAAYPIVIDPTVTYYGDDNLIRDKYVYSTYSSDTSYIKVGYSGSLTYRSYIEFDLTQIPEDVKIDFAHLTLRTYPNRNYCTNDCVIVAREVLSTFDYDDINATGLDVTSSREIDFANVLYSDGSSGIYTFDMTYNMEKWVDNGDTTRSIELRSQNEAATGYIYFNSENYSSTLGPILEVGYVNTHGIKDFWTYNSQDVGAVGTGYVSDYTGYLTFLRNDFNFTTDKQSLGLSFAYSNANRDTDIGYGNGWNVSYNSKVLYDSFAEEYYVEDYTGNKTYYYPLPSCTGSYVSSYPYTNTCYISEDGSQKTMVRQSAFGTFTGTHIYDDGQKYTYNTSGYLSTITSVEYSLSITIYRDLSNYDKIDKIKDSSGNYLRFIYDANDRLTDILLRTAEIEADDPNVVNGYYLEKATYTYYTTSNLRYVTFYTDYDQNRVGTLDTRVYYTYDYYNRLYTAYISGGEKVIYTYVSSLNDQVSTIQSYFYYTKFSEVSYDYNFRETIITDHTDNFVIYKFDDYGHTVNMIDKNTNTVYYEYMDIFNDWATQVYGNYNYKKNHLLVNQSVPQKQTFNPVENYSFEIGTYTGWSITSQLSAFKSSYEVVGNYSLGTTDYYNNGGYAYQEITLNEGVYTLRASIRNDSGSTSGAYIEVSGITSENVTNDSQWYNVSVPIYISSDNTTITIKLYNQTAGTVRYDNVSIIDGINDTRVNIVDNSSFELNGTTGWSITDPGNTTYYSINDGSNDINETFEYILGEYAVGIKGSTTTSRSIYQSILKNNFTEVAANGGKFYVGGWANTYLAPLVGNTNYDGDKVFRIKVEFIYNSSVLSANTQYINFNQSVSSWQYVYGEVTAPTLYDSVRVSYEYIGLGEVLFDGMSVFFEADNTNYEYDSEGRVERIIFEDGKEFNYTYSEVESYIPSSVEDENGNETEIDSTDNEVNYVVRDNIKSTPTYNSYGQVTEMTIYGKNSSDDWVEYFDTSTVYIHNNQYVSETTDEFGNTTDYMTSELTGLMQYIENAAGVKTQYEYYDDGLLYKVYIGESLTSTTPYVKYVYDSKNRLIEIELDDNYSYYIHYDSQGRMDYVKVNNQTLMSYDYLIDVYETGIIESQTYGNGDEIVFEYNDDNQVEYIKFTPYLQTEITKFYYQYDSYGRVSVYEDLVNQITEYYEYDSSGNLAKVTNQNDDEIIYGYDQQGNLTSIDYNIESIDSETTYDYQTGTTYDFYDYTEYDNGNNIIKKNFIYESLGLRRLDYIEFFSGANNFMDLEFDYVTNTTRIEQITYNISSSSFDDISYKYYYDNLGNITKEEYGLNGTIVVTKKYWYDDYNQLIQESSKDTRITTSNPDYYDYWYVKTYSYDVNGNIEIKKVFEYENTDYIVMEKTVNAYQTNTGSEQMYVQYNGSYSYANIYSVPVNGNINMSFSYYEYTWPPQQLSGITTSYNITGINTSTPGYYLYECNAHDSSNTFKLNFGIVVKVGNIFEGTLRDKTTYNYDSTWLDQLESYEVLIEGGVTKTSDITYDTQGNPIQITNFNYMGTKRFYATLNWEGRELVNITIYNSSIAVIAEIDYTYNDQGIRIQKEITDSLGTTTYEYKLSGSALIAEIVTDAYNESTSDRDLDYKIAYNYDYDGSMIGFTYFVGTTKTDYIYAKNLQGDITHILTVVGDVVVEYYYDSYGNIVGITGTLADSIGLYNSFRYRSYKYDSEISMYYLNSRYYNPEIGRFINSDAMIGNPGEVLSNNYFNYANNNPVMNVDSYGFASEENPNLVSILSRESKKIVAGRLLHVKWGTITYDEDKVISGSKSAIIDFYMMSNLSTDPSCALLPSYGIRVNLGEVSLISSLSLGGRTLGISIGKNYFGVSTGFSISGINVYYNFTLEINGGFISFQPNLTLGLAIIIAVVAICYFAPALVLAGASMYFLGIFDNNIIEGE
ncbi:MAG: DNRLRE domain-containing protein [Tenericutes bacterium]|nr:DNRLRE domain-containing protein [Mycoplasmatota bacterium]